MLELACAGTPNIEPISTLSPTIKLDSNTLRQVFISLLNPQNELKPGQANYGLTGDERLIAQYLNMPEEEKLKYREEFKAVFKKESVSEYKTSPLFKDESMQELIQTTKELVSEYPNARIVSLGRSPLLFTEMANLIELLENKKSNAARYKYVAFSRTWYRRQSNIGPLKPISAFEPNAEEKDVYRDYLEKLGMDPESIIASKEKTVIVEYTQLGEGLMSFLSFLLEWAEELNMTEELKSKVIVNILQDPENERFSDFGGFTIRHQLVNHDFINSIVNDHKETIGIGVGVHYPMERWLDESVNPFQPEDLKRAELEVFWMLDFLVQNNLVDIANKSEKEKSAYLASFLNKKDKFSLGVDIKTVKNPDGTKKVVIKFNEQNEIMINIPNWPERSIYDYWISKQYGTMAIADYPHLTTKLMIDAMIANSNLFKNSVVLEAGIGDGILAVLARRLGAKRVYGMDNQQEALDIARQVSSLNETENIQLMQGDFINNEFNLEEEPTILLLNIGVYIQENMVDLIKKYPSLKHVILVGENVWVYGGKERLIDLLLQIADNGNINFSNYFEQPAYYQNVFNEGYWSFVIGLEGELSLSSQMSGLLDNRLINVFFERDKKGIRTTKYPQIIKMLLDNGNEIVREVITKIEAEGEQWIEQKGKERLKRFNDDFDDGNFEIVNSWDEFVAIETSGRYDLSQLFSYSLGIAHTYYQLLSNDKREDDAEIKQGFRKSLEDGYIILRAIEIAAREDKVEPPEVNLELLILDSKPTYDLIQQAI